MKKQILILPLLMPLSIWAQEKNNKTKIDNSINNEILEVKSSLLEHKAIFNKVNLSTTTNSPTLLQNIDFSSPDSLVNLSEINGSRNQDHYIKNTTISHDVELSLHGIIYADLNCYNVEEAYEISDKQARLFKYENTYFIFKDRNDKIIVTIAYLKRKVGFLEENFKIVSSTTNQSANIKFSIFPNPTADHLNVRYQVPSLGIYTLKVQDINGRTVAVLLDKKEIAAGEYEIDTNLSLVSGNYFVVFESLNNQTTQKLIIK